MRPCSLHDRCLQRLRGLEIPRPFRLDVFAATVADRRRRALHVLPLPGLDGSDGLSGAWVATDAADYVLIDADASPWHRNLIGLHEIGHLLCGHGGEDGGLRGLAGDLLPCLSGVTIQRILGRHGYGGSDEEEEAELMACLILKLADAGPVSVSSVAGVGVGVGVAFGGRLAHSLRHSRTSCLPRQYSPGGRFPASAPPGKLWPTSRHCGLCEACVTNWPAPSPARRRIPGDTEPPVPSATRASASSAGPPRSATPRWPCAATSLLPLSRRAAADTPHWG